jgi:hypothetical protein
MFINRIIKNLEDHVMEATFVGVTNVHSRALANGLETFEFVDLGGIVFLGRADSGRSIFGQFFDRNFVVSLQHKKRVGTTRKKHSRESG